MKVLVIGGGGREHALVWKIKQSPRVDQIFCAPGNAGIAQDAHCVNIKADDIPNLLAFAQKEKIDLTVVGPEAPLLAGVVETFQEHGLKIFGPRKRAAEIEGSKALAKEIMVKYGIPTGSYAEFTDPAEAIAYIREKGAPIVVKADGLAAGKGVVVAMDEQTAIDAVKIMMEDKVFGDSGSKIIIEEFLDGEEVSVLAFSDGVHVVPMASSQDHKRIFDNDQGPNTGGMGAYSPAPVFTLELAEFTLRNVLQPVIKGMAAEGRTYTGVIYAGLIVTKEGPKVLEFNARFGDPETQPILSRLETDLMDIIEAILAEKLDTIEIKWRPEASVCVVLASAGYPGSYEKGNPINGLKEAAADAIVFHAGTAQKGSQIVTSGGRVLGVTALGPDIVTAIKNAYQAVDKINFPGMQYRKDIGKKALNK